MTSPLTPQDCVSEFIKLLTALDREKSPYDKFRDFCEMVFCAKAKRVALTFEHADELEDRYMQIVGTYRDKDTVRAYPGLLALAHGAIRQGCDFLGSVALCAPAVPAVRLYSTAIARKSDGVTPRAPFGVSAMR
jgi:hypothetical protein